MPIYSKKLDGKTKGRLRQFYRLLLSYTDFKQAKLTAEYIIDENLHAKEDQIRFLEALNCAMIVAYCRPFSGSERGASVKVPVLPRKFLAEVPEEELLIHDVVMHDRNKYIAHTDSVASNLRPMVQELAGKKYLIPYQEDILAPLTLEATKTFYSLANRLFEKVIVDRHNQEPEFLPYFEVEKSDLSAEIFNDSE